MSWIVLVISGLFEAVWAVALGASEGFTRLVPTVVFAVGILLSTASLAWAMKDIPMGTAYAVWAGIGASLAVAYGMVFGGEAFSVVNALLMIGLVGCIVGPKAVS